MMFTFETTVEREDEGFDVKVTYSISPIIEATYWQPAEGGEVELISVKKDGKEITLTDAEEDALIEECIARSGDDMADEAAAQADWRYQEYRDRQLMEKWERP